MAYQHEGIGLVYKVLGLLAFCLILFAICWYLFSGPRGARTTPPAPHGQLRLVPPATNCRSALG